MKRHLKSLRAYIDALAAIGEVQTIDKEVDWQLEIGAIARRCYETGAPAPLFNTIKGIESGFRVLAAPAGVSKQPGLYLSRLAVSLGLPPEATGRDIVETLVEARSKAFIPPTVVASGPCKENILTGDDVDLLRLPTPLLHGGDGGRYLNTYGIFVVQTPDKKWTSWSIARAMLLDKNRMAGIVAPNQHIGMVRQTWTDIGQPMPFALALGVEPFIPFVGGMPLPEYVNEVDYVGAYFGEPVEVVQCETVDLDLTNTKEVVWAFATRNYPGSKGEVVFNDESTNPLVAFLTNNEKMSMHTTKVIYNCLPPDDWGDRLPQRSSFVGTYPDTLQASILQNWQAYGFH